MYPRSGFRSWGTCERTLVPGFRSGGRSERTLVPVLKFVPGEHPPKPPFWKPPFWVPPTHCRYGHDCGCRFVDAISETSMKGATAIAIEGIFNNWKCRPFLLQAPPFLLQGHQFPLSESGDSRESEIRGICANRPGALQK